MWERGTGFDMYSAWGKNLCVNYNPTMKASEATEQRSVNTTVEMLWKANGSAYDSS